MSVIDTTKIDFWEPHPGSRMRVIGNGEHVTLVYARLQLDQMYLNINILVNKWESVFRAKLLLL